MTRKDLSTLKQHCPEDPTAAVAYWENILMDIIDSIGCSIDAYKWKVKTAGEKLKNTADHLDQVLRDVGISKTAGGGAGIAGGLMTVGGLLLAPFTGGFSLTLSVGGMITGALGGITSLGATLGKEITEGNKVKEGREITNEAIELTVLLQGILNEYMKKLEEAGRYIQQQLQCNENMEIDGVGDPILQQINCAKDVANQTKAIVITSKKVSKVLTYYKSLKEIVMLTGNGNSKASLLLMGTTSQFAKDFSAPGFRIGSKCAVTAGGTTARLLSGAMGVVGIGFGIWECIEGADNIKNGSEVAKQFRETAVNLNDAMEEIIETYDGLSS